MKLPPSADCRRRFTFVNRHQFPIFKKQCGGADRDRTCDPRVANAMLSQLSYSPLIYIRLNHSTYWWVWEDLNFRPPPYQRCALTT